MNRVRLILWQLNKTGCILLKLDILSPDHCRADHATEYFAEMEKNEMYKEQTIQKNIKDHQNVSSLRNTILHCKTSTCSVKARVLHRQIHTAKLLSHSN